MVVLRGESKSSPGIIKAGFPKGAGLFLCVEFDLTQINAGFTLIFMDKQEIKRRLLEAVKKDEHLTDIKSVAVFGSCVNGTATADSDVDVLIDFESTAVIGFFALSDIKDNFELFLQKSVDLLTPQAISNYFRDEVLEQAEYVYEK